MLKEKFIPLLTLCSHYKVEMNFIYDLSENDLLEIVYVEKEPCIHEDLILKLEKILRLHHDLEINIAGIDAIMTLLNHVDGLQEKVNDLQNRLRLYEE